MKSRFVLQVQVLIDIEHARWGARWSERDLRPLDQTEDVQGAYFGLDKRAEEPGIRNHKHLDLEKDERQHIVVDLPLQTLYQRQHHQHLPQMEKRIGNGDGRLWK